MRKFSRILIGSFVVAGTIALSGCLVANQPAPASNVPVYPNPAYPYKVNLKFANFSGKVIKTKPAYYNSINEDSRLPINQYFAAGRILPTLIINYGKKGHANNSAGSWITIQVNSIRRGNRMYNINPAPTCTFIIGGMPTANGQVSRTANSLPCSIPEKLTMQTMLDNPEVPTKDGEVQGSAVSNVTIKMNYQWPTRVTPAQQLPRTSSRNAPQQTQPKIVPNTAQK